MGRLRTITLAPKDIPEAVAHTQELFYLADLYRTPVILYGDMSLPTRLSASRSRPWSSVRSPPKTSGPSTAP